MNDADATAERVKYVWRECELQNVMGHIYVSCPVPGGMGSLDASGRQHAVAGTGETCTWSLASTSFMEWLGEKQPASLKILRETRGVIERQALATLRPVTSDVLPWVP